MQTLVFQLDTSSTLPLYRQLYEALRDAILRQHLAAGSRLPATRVLAQELAVSRNTVVSAFDQLLAEGYIESRVGDGSYVSHALDELPRLPMTIAVLARQGFLFGYAAATPGEINAARRLVAAFGNEC